MYDKIFNTLAILTIGGIAFITCALPKVFETEEEPAVCQAIEIPVYSASVPDMSKTIQRKAIDDAYASLSDAMALCDIALNIKPIREFKPYKLVYAGSFYLTMYAATVEQCGNTLGITASGRKVTDDPTCWTVAVDPSVIPLGTYLMIEGYDGIIFRADDTGSAVKGYHIDIFTTSEAESKSFPNVYGADVWIVEEI